MFVLGIELTTYKQSYQQLNREVSQYYNIKIMILRKNSQIYLKKFLNITFSYKELVQSPICALSWII